MDWQYQPGRPPLSLPTDCPSAEMIAAFNHLLDTTPLKLRNYERDRDTLWQRLDEEVQAGRLPASDVEVLRRDHEGHFSVPLARRYLSQGNAVAVTKWMRNLAPFWSYDWVDRSLKGGRGRGTINLFETLRDNGGALEGAELAANHLWHRLVGARYHEGLRHELRVWFKQDSKQRRKAVAEHRAQFSNAHHIEMLFEWLNHIASMLRPCIEAGSGTARERLAEANAEIAASRSKFYADLK